MGDYRGFRRAAHLRYVAMPGGEQAIREPWRMAAAYLVDADVHVSPLWTRMSPQQSRRTIETMIARRFNSPLDLQRGAALRRGRGAGRGPRHGRATRDRRRSSWNGWPSAVAPDGVLSVREIVRRERRSTVGHRHAADDRRGRRRTCVAGLAPA